MSEYFNGGEKLANKAGITGGIFSLLGASGLFALWWFVIGPALAARGLINLLWMYVIYHLLTQGLADLLLDFFLQEVFAGIILLELLLVLTYITTMPIQVNLWGIIQLDPFICIIVLVGLIALGGILGMVGSREY